MLLVIGILVGLLAAETYIIRCFIRVVARLNERINQQALLLNEHPTITDNVRKFPDKGVDNHST